MNNRIAYFDQMKGLAIILVVIGHVTQFSLGLHGSDLNRWLEIFHMPVFFFVSGYFAYKILPSVQDVVGRVWSRIHAIAIPLLVWCVLCTFTHGDESFVSMLSRCGGKYWFLYTLTILAVFFVAYEQLSKRFKHPAMYVSAWLFPFALLALSKLKLGG